MLKTKIYYQKKIASILCLLVFMFSTHTWSQKNIYESTQFKVLSKGHKEIAILPFLATVHLAEAVSPEAQKTIEASEGYAVQNALETYFLKIQKRKKLRVSVQNIKDTNAFLKKNDINYANLDIYSIEELSEILGVDAIISGSIHLNVQLSKGNSKEFNIIDYVTGNTKYGRIGIKISDASSGKLLWKYEKQIDRKTGKNTQELIESMMKQVSRKIPYELE